MFAPPLTPVTSERAGGAQNQACSPPAETHNRTMLGETENQFSLTHAVRSTGGGAKRKFLSVIVYVRE